MKVEVDIPTHVVLSLCPELIERHSNITLDNSLLRRENERLKDEADRRERGCARCGTLGNDLSYGVHLTTSGHYSEEKLKFCGGCKIQVFFELALEFGDYGHGAIWSEADLEERKALEKIVRPGLQTARKNYRHTCTQCGADFISINRAAKYCGESCRKKAARARQHEESVESVADDPMIRRTLMTDIQRKADEKIMKLFRKSQGTSEHEGAALLEKAKELVEKHDITIVKKEVLEWLHQPIMSAETRSTQLGMESPLSLVSSTGE